MQVKISHLLVIGAISLWGGVSGLVLGNFVAGGQRQTGSAELAAYSAQGGFAEEALQDDPALMEPAMAIRQGPTSYDCQGCDAKLHPEDDVVDLSQYEPLPPYAPYEYDPYDPAEPAVRVNGVRRDIRARDQRESEPQRDAPEVRSPGNRSPDTRYPDARYGAAPLLAE